jgi:hypothetical protein
VKTRPYRNNVRTLAAMVVVAGGAQVGWACDLCAVYSASEAQGVYGKGFVAGVAEQFTHFGTLQQDGQRVSGEGQYIDSSVSQVFVGYNFNNRIGVQLNVPVIYRAWGSQTQHDSTSGIGDLFLVGNFTAYEKLTEKTTLNWTLLGGVKFPTGNSSLLGEPEDAFPPGIAGHDVALGSGSYDGLVGTSVFARWNRLFVAANVQYAIRSEGDFQHQYANDLLWEGGPGAYLLLKDQYTLRVQAVVSGETKGKDTFNGVPDEDSAETLLYLGPQLGFTWGNHWSVTAGVDWPVYRDNSGLQVLPDYRAYGAVTFRF